MVEIDELHVALVVEDFDREDLELAFSDVFRSVINKRYKMLWEKIAPLSEKEVADIFVRARMRKAERSVQNGKS